MADSARSVYRVVAEHFEYYGYEVFVEDDRCYKAVGVKPSVLAIRGCTVASAELVPRFSPDVVPRLVSYLRFSDYVYMVLTDAKGYPELGPWREVLERLGIGVMYIERTPINELWIAFDAERNRGADCHSKDLLRYDLLGEYAWHPRDSCCCVDGEDP